MPLTSDQRAVLRQIVNQRTRLSLVGPPVESRCLGAASESRYSNGCHCVDCRAASARVRGENRRKQTAEGRDSLLSKIRVWMRRHPIEGADIDDGMQIALLAVEEARGNYKPEIGVPFDAFAYEVAKLRLYDERVRASRLKHRVLTSAVAQTEDEETFFELLPDKTPDPYEVVVHRLELQAIIRAMASLTELERLALSWVLNGESYAGSREVDNAIQRARRKLRSVRDAA